MKLYSKKGISFSVSLCTMCLCVFSVSFAADRVLLNESTVIRRALEESETYRISHNHGERIYEQYREVRAQILPQLNGESIWTYNTSYSGDTIQEYDAVNTISATQVLWAFGRINSAISAAQKSFRISEFDTKATKRDLIYTAQRAYYTAILAGETYAIVEKSYQNAVENKQILDDRSGKGRISKRDNIKIAADVAARIPVVSNARAQSQSALNSLKMIVGLPFSQEVELIETFADAYEHIDYNKREAQLIADEPSLRALAESVRVKEDLVSQRKAGYLPVVSAFGSYSYNGEGDRPEIGSHNLDTRSHAGVKVSVPIFSGFETGAQLAQARIERKNAALYLRQATEDLTVMLKNAVSNYHAFLETLAANNEAVRLAEESFHLSQGLFTTGQITVTDLNDAELQLTNQRLSREQTLYNINVTMAEIEKLTTREVAGE